MKILEKMQENRDGNLAEKWGNGFGEERREFGEENCTCLYSREKKALASKARHKQKKKVTTEASWIWAVGPIYYCFFIFSFPFFSHNFILAFYFSLHT